MPADRNAGQKSQVDVSAADTSLNAVASTAGQLPAEAGSLPEQIGRFRVKSLLGSGAFGDVYLAVDLQLQREVALKVPRQGTFQSDQEAERFRREARAVAALQHPSICPIHDVLDEHGVPVIVMGYIRGKRLDEFITRKRLPSIEQSVRLVRRLAKTLQYAHDQGIVHRDLKPANIIIESDRKEPVIMDFGLARAGAAEDSRLTRTGQLLGSPAYMSPEQASADHAAIGPHSDVYSLGVILYELLCGTRPFDGSVGEVLAALLYVEPPPPSSRRSDLDPQLDAICQKAMAKNPAERYADMNAMDRDLRSWLKSPAASSSDSSDVSELNSKSEAMSAVLDTASLIDQAIDPSVDHQLAGHLRSGHLIGRFITQTFDTRAKLLTAGGTLCLLAVIIILVIRRDDAPAEMVPPRTLQQADASSSPMSNTTGRNERTVTPEEPASTTVVSPFSVQRSWHSDQSSYGWVACAFSPDSRRLATGNQDLTVKIWDPSTGELIRKLDGYKHGVFGIGWSRDGRYICSSAWGGMIRIWDAESFELVKELSLPVNKLSMSKSAWCVAFSPDGTRLYAAGGVGGLTSRTDTAEERIKQMENRWDSMPKPPPIEMRERMKDRIRASYGSPSNYGCLTIWNTDNWEVLATVSAECRAIRRLCLPDDGKYIVTSGSDGELSIRDSVTGEVRKRVAPEVVGSEYVQSAAVSPDGHWIAADLSDRLLLYDVRADEVRHHLQLPDDCGIVSFSPDSQDLLCGIKGHPARLWNVASGELLAQFPEGAGSPHQFAPDQRSVVAAGPGKGDVMILGYDRSAVPER